MFVPFTTAPRESRACDRQTQRPVVITFGTGRLWMEFKSRVCCSDVVALVISCLTMF